GTYATFIGGNKITFSSTHTLTDSRVVDIAGGTTVEFSGNIDGTGNLAKLGYGRLNMYGDNSYSGGTNLGRGELYVNSSTSLGTGTLNFTDNGFLASTTNVTLANQLAFNTSYVAAI